jgi:hypothetical protein
VGLKPAPDQRVMRPHELERRAVAKARGHLGRTDDVSEHDGAQSGVHNGLGSARRRTRIADTAEKCLDSRKIDRDDGVGDLAMRLTMDSLGGFGIRRVDEAEGGAIVLVEPIRHVFYAVSILDVDIPAVRLSDVLRLQTTQIVAVHKNRHAIPLRCRGGWSPCEAIAIFAGCALPWASRLILWVCSRRLYSQASRLVKTRALAKNGARQGTTGP